MTQLTKEQLTELEKKIRDAVFSSTDPEILEIIKDYELDEDSSLNEMMGAWCDFGDPDDLLCMAGDLDHIDTDCVHGDGSEAYMVFKHLPTGATVGITGWYASSEGYNWEDAELSNMAPYQVTHYGKAE